MTKQNFTFLMINPMLDTIDLIHVKANDRLEATELITPNLKLHEMPIIISERQLKILIAKLEYVK